MQHNRVGADDAVFCKKLEVVQGEGTLQTSPISVSTKTISQHMGQISRQACCEKLKAIDKMPHTETDTRFLL